MYEDVKKDNFVYVPSKKGYQPTGGGNLDTSNPPGNDQGSSSSENSNSSGGDSASNDNNS